MGSLLVNVPRRSQRVNRPRCRFPYERESSRQILIEAVTTDGPIDRKRHIELEDLFGAARAGLVYVTTFPSRSAMTRYVGRISWETEVWVADEPDHLMHFVGERFLGPYEKDGGTDEESSQGEGG
ncbi:MAG: BsuBI/PstI family type II restriction endonuclease [Longimicrobiales bacterium]